jgi:hypothetical protein
LERLRREEGRKEVEEIKKIEEEGLEKERLAKARLKLEEKRGIAEEERRKFLERLEPEKEKNGLERKEARVPPAFFRPLPKKPSYFEKLFVRLVILAVVILIIAAIAFGYLYFKNKTNPFAFFSKWITEKQIKEPEPSPGVLPETPTPQETPPPQPPPLLVIPESPILIGETKTFGISNKEEVPLIYTAALNEDSKANQFTRVLIESPSENRLISLSEFLTGLGISPPEGFYQIINDQEVFFIWVQKEGKRFGFLTQIQDKEGLKTIMTNWESNMEKDFNPLFLPLGKTGPAYRKTFKDFNYKGINFRCQTFTLKDLGLCYLVSDQYLFFTSSSQSMSEIIEEVF